MERIPKELLRRMEVLNRRVDEMAVRELRKKDVTIKFTQTEYERLKGQADEAQIPFAIFIRAKILKDG